MGALLILNHLLDLGRILWMTVVYLIEILHYRLFVRNKITTENEENVEGKVAVITGGSRGMGKSSAKALAARGAVVIIGDVNVTEGQKTVDEIKRETGNKNVKIWRLDLSDMKSVEEFAKKVSKDHPKIKILLNNAGIGGSPRKTEKTKDGFNIHIVINHLGHFLLTNLLLDNLKREKKSRVVSMASSMLQLSHLDLDDLMMDKSGFGLENGLPYCNSKYCNVLFIKELAKRVVGTEVKAYAVCPGLVDTEIFESVKTILSKAVFSLFVKLLGVSPDNAAYEYILYCILDKNLQNESGKLYRTRKSFSQVNNIPNDELARKLWEKSSNLVKLNERLKSIK